MKEGVACYQAYLRGLLDLTDNLVGGKVVPPPDVVRHDADDPYLVVAADKGTATFSDIANGVAAEYGFWLGDAFASGGSAGYDHKKMGITARGAWESVKRHFRSLGIDTQSQRLHASPASATCRATCSATACCCRATSGCVAAFDHRHIFIDPNPDAEASFVERERLFALPRSSWADYDAKLISAGGGVYPRSAKSIALSPRGARGARHRGRQPDAERADARDPAGAGGPVLQRRHRHLREVERRERTPKSATAPTTRSASTAPTCAARWSPKAATSASRSAGASSTRSRGGLDQHRRHRQLGRRGLLGPRGQHQDPAQRGRRRRRADRPSSATSCSPR